MSDNASSLVSGYDLPVYGLNDGSFYTLHILALSCIGVSFTCAAITLIVSFCVPTPRGLFNNRPKRERFVIYMALFDGLFNLSHIADHLHMFLSKDHVYPKGLCAFYGFNVFSTILAQNLLVNMIAINAFALMFFNYSMNFGKWDWRLIAWVAGLPVACGVVSVIADKLGPSGAYCLFDGVKGSVFNLVLISVPVIVIFITNTALYFLTWIRLQTQTRAVRRSLGRASAGMKAAHRAARAMALFVLAYLVQWWALAVSGCWAAATDGLVPREMIQITVFFTNIGGVLNLVVFVLIRRSGPDGQKGRGHEGMTTSSGDIPTISASASALTHSALVKT